MTKLGMMGAAAPMAAACDTQKSVVQNQEAAGMSINAMVANEAAVENDDADESAVNVAPSAPEAAPAPKPAPRPAPRPSAPEPAPKPEPVDPHAGHDMNNMQ